MNRIPSSSAKRAALAATLLPILTTFTYSQVVGWDGGTGGNFRVWSSATTWSNDEVPTSTTDVVIGNTELGGTTTLLGGGSYLALSAQASRFDANARSITFTNERNQFPNGTLDFRNSSATTAQIGTLTLHTPQGLSAVTLTSGNVTLSSRTIAAYMQLNLNYSGLRDFNIASGSTLFLDGSNNSATGQTTVPFVTGTGGINKTGLGTLRLNGGNNFAGLTISSGTVEAGRVGSLGTGTVTIGTAGGANASLIRYLGGWDIANNIVTASGATGTLTLGTVANLVTDNNDSRFNGSITLNSNLTVETNLVGPEGTRRGINLNGAITGDGGITKIGTGNVRFTGNNSYAGTTTILEGTVEIGLNIAASGNGLTGSFGSGNVVNHGEIRINRLNNYTLGNTISGTGKLTQAGSGITTLTAANSYTGDTEIFDGGSIVLAENAELRFRLANNNSSNSVFGAGSASFFGTFVVDRSAVTDAIGTWNLVNVATLSEMFSGSFTLRFLDQQAEFESVGGGQYSSGDWVFDTSTGNLSLIPEPSAFAGFAGLGALGFAALRRRRR